MLLGGTTEGSYITEVWGAYTRLSRSAKVLALKVLALCISITIPPLACSCLVLTIDTSQQQDLSLV